MRFTLLDFGTVEREAARLASVSRASVRTLPVMEEIATDMLAVEKLVFSSQGRRGGGSWKRPKPDTQARKGGSKILFTEGAVTGYGSGENRLYKSVTTRGHPDSLLKVFNKTIWFGTNRPGAASHQYGAPGQGIPRREFIRFLPTDHFRWNDRIGRHLIRPHMVR